MRKKLHIVAALFMGSLTFISDAQVTGAKQELLTPDQVIERLMSGNERYVKGELSAVDIPERITATASGQYPKAVILSCLDSCLLKKFLI